MHPVHCFGSALNLIGGTPPVALDRAYPGPGRILAKVEFLQPGGSVKDRAARAVACIGMGATFLGIAAALRTRNPHIVCAAVEPAGCEPLRAST